ncbi:MAG: RNA polymerase sigma factor [Nocardioidaceae bacterium]
MGTPTATAEAVTAAWRAESARLVAALARMTRDLTLAEDLAQDALVAALEQWPQTGIPDNPAAWLTTTARRRAVDHFRRASALRRKVEAIGRDLDEADVPDLDAQVDHIGDDVLRLMFLCCHPVLSADSRAALTLRLVAGLSTAEIARGFFVAESTMGQRLSRAKRTLQEAGADLDLPAERDRRARLDDVMAVVYLVFNEGYTATAGPDWTRPDLCHEAIRLSRILAAQAPGDPDPLALQALLEIQASRLPARTDAHGRAVLLEDQDRSRWDQLLRRRGLAALDRAAELAAGGRSVGRYFLQAAIAAEHARAPRAERTDWAEIARLYDLLARAAPGPVVEVNRAVAHGRAFGPLAGLEVLDAIAGDALAGSPLVPSVRGDLLERLGRRRDAAAQFREAAAQTRNDIERALLLRRADEVLAHR